MTNIPGPTENVETEAADVTANKKPSDSTKSAATHPAQQATDAELHEAEKPGAQCHYYSREIAEAHGANAATVLAGLAFKLKYHKKNFIHGRYWYYETNETLAEKRWPYWGATGVWGIIKYLVEDAKLVHRNNYNRMPLDRTAWLAVDDDVRDAALRDLVWFNVAVAKKCTIAAATIYHNLQFTSVPSSRGTPKRLHSMR